jgi:hypothetical protein
VKRTRWVRVGVEEELRLAEEVAAWKSNLVFTTNNQMFFSA